MNAGSAGLILHVDDEQSIRASMSILLSTDGYEVSSAASGAEALQFARGGLHPDVLILDFNLGQQINGAEIAEQIRRVLSYAPPIIMLTGDVSHTQTFESKAAAGHLAKSRATITGDSEPAFKIGVESL
jgi:CheY-like chemotaxis protein